MEICTLYILTISLFFIRNLIHFLACIASSGRFIDFLQNIAILIPCFLNSCLEFIYIQSYSQYYVSSPYIIGLPRVRCSTSFLYRKKSDEPRREPWGTPHQAETLLDKYSFSRLFGPCATLAVFQF